MIELENLLYRAEKRTLEMGLPLEWGCPALPTKAGSRVSLCGRWGFGELAAQRQEQSILDKKKIF